MWWFGEKLNLLYINSINKRYVNLKFESSTQAIIPPKISSKSPKYDGQVLLYDRHNAKHFTQFSPSFGIFWEHRSHFTSLSSREWSLSPPSNGFCLCLFFLFQFFFVILGLFVMVSLIYFSPGFWFLIFVVVKFLHAGVKAHKFNSIHIHVIFYFGEER